MITRINKQYIFVYACPKECVKITQIYKFKIVVSLLGMLIGIFLLPQIAYLSEITSENILELTNIERQKENLNTLTANHLLTKAAYEKGQAIIENNTFQHTINNKKFSQWIKDTGYSYSFVGENLAIDFVTSEGTIKAWLESETHRRNLLNPIYKETGVAVINDKFNNIDTIVIVQTFGAPPGMISGEEYSNNISKLITSNYVNDYLNHKPENLLTHSIAYENNNAFTILKNSELFPVAYSSTNYGNTFFEQYKINNYTLIQFLMYFFYLTLLFAVLYIYYFTFLHITKYKNLSPPWAGSRNYKS